MVNASVQITDSTRKLAETIMELKELAVYVGIPEDKAGRKSNFIGPVAPGSEAITNAQLAYIHTHGVRSQSMRREMDPDVKSGARKYSEAYSLYVQAHGSPMFSIPARPIIEPAIEAMGNKEPIAAELGEAIKAALDGSKPQCVAHMKRAGMIGQNAVRAWFTDPRNGWPQNSPATIAEKIGKLKGAKFKAAKSVLDSGENLASINTPLVDTGQMRKAITYVVGQKGQEIK